MITLAFAIAAIACVVLAGCAFLHASASYSLSFAYCTEPRMAHAATPRCQASLLYGYLFWGLLGFAVVLSAVAVFRRWRHRALTR